MAGKTETFGPILLTTTTTTNIWNPPTTTGGTGLGTPSPYIIIRTLRAVNVTNAACRIATWVGTTGVNTIATAGPFPGQASAAALTQGITVPANGVLDWVGFIRLTPSLFFVGGAETASAVVLIGGGEYGIA